MTRRGMNTGSRQQAMPLPTGGVSRVWEPFRRFAGFGGGWRYQTLIGSLLPSGRLATQQSYKFLSSHCDCSNGCASLTASLESRSIIVRRVEIVRCPQ